MADPLSIASGTAGLLSLGIEVTKLLFKFYTEYKGQGTELASITKKLDGLQSLFKALGAAVEEQRLQAGTQNQLQEVDKNIQDCEEAIKELQTECEKFCKHSAVTFKDRARVAGRRAAYPFRRSTIEKLEEDVDDIRENLEFALSILNVKNQSQIQNDILGVKALLERVDASQVSSSIITWLRAPDANANHYTAHGKCHPSTGLWFINGCEFQTWLVEPESFLWLNGFAGCGKSVLCSTAIQHTLHAMEHKHRTGIAFYYFSFNVEAKQDDHGMLRALLLQLSVQLEDGEKDLKRLYERYKSGSPPVYALFELLQFFLGQFRDAYILLDALDESPRNNHKRDAVLKAIGTIRNWQIPGVHLLVTSRNDQDIRTWLEPSYNQDIPLRNPEVDKDIENFTSHQLRYNKKLQRWKERHNEIQERLAIGAQGVFRWVECQLNNIQRARNWNQLDKCLHTLPRDLDETYERILCSIEEEYVGDVQRVLTLLCFSNRPLTVDELLHAHAVDLSEPPRFDHGRLYTQDDLVDICLGLVEIAPTENQYGQMTFTAHIAHFSVQEYLLSDRIPKNNLEKFAMRSELANTEIAKICLVYLLQPALSDGTVDGSKGTEFPFAHFAAKYWFTHYSNSIGGKDATETLISKLFNETKAFVTWIQFHDMDNNFGFSRRSIIALNMSLRLYYAALLGLEFVLNSILIAIMDDDSSDAVNSRGGRYGNALQAAAHRGHEKVVQMLLDSAAEFNAQGGIHGDALYAAAHRGHEKIVQMLLEHGAEVNAHCGSYGNALNAAAHEGHEKMVQMLLEHGAEVNAQGGVYGNALLAAAHGGHKNVVQVLLENGAEVNVQDEINGNALQAAAHKGSADTAGEIS